MEETNMVSYKYMKDRLEEVKNGSLNDFLHMWYKMGSTEQIHSKYLDYLGNLSRHEDSKKYNTTKVAHSQMMKVVDVFEATLPEVS